MEDRLDEVTLAVQNGWSGRHEFGASQLPLQRLSRQAQENG
jgi:hypothetical protein